LKAKVIVVIPCYKVKAHIEKVIRSIGSEVDTIIVVDDACPEGSGQFISENISDPRIELVFLPQNRGVGGAVKAGYKKALEMGANIVVKLDGDGQMPAEFIPQLIAPLVSGKADYVKGNRFYSFYTLKEMPKLRLFGNAVLGFFTKLSSGYWSVVDPTNGFTAIHSYVLNKINFEGLDDRYFFETDMLILLGDLRAHVLDMPMKSIYADEESNLKILDVMGVFLLKHLKSTFRRILYSYYLRNFTLASIELPLGIILLMFGVYKGGYEWMKSMSTGELASTGTVFLAALPIILGVQFLLGFISEDIANEPKISMQVFKVDEQN
jgi:dolichol-phosphate mannosyltransferase